MSHRKYMYVTVLITWLKYLHVNLGSDFYIKFDQNI